MRGYELRSSAKSSRSEEARTSPNDRVDVGGVGSVGNGGIGGVVADVDVAAAGEVAAAADAADLYWQRIRPPEGRAGVSAALVDVAAVLRRRRTTLMQHVRCELG
eukprot:4353751-Pleurochrysis_carterae.AAC.1